MFAATSLPSAAVAGDKPVVRIESGLVAGATRDGIDSFKGIPFAAPPIGTLRWRAPQPVAKWRNVREATTYGFDCAQTPFPLDAAPLAAPLSEDCLNLSLWRPTDVSAMAPLPVLVWIHGGGFVNGGISPSIFAGDAFARDRVILVGINYRLGRFGFFAHPALRKADADKGRSGNFAIMDQIAALRWIRRNIAAFGGDPGNVTIMGESAGGMSALMLLTSPEAQGLFHRAIIQSGGGRVTDFSNRSVTEDQPGVPSLEATGKAFAARNGIEGDDAKALSRLRALPASVVEGGLHMMTSAQQRDIYGGPSIDHRFVVGSLETLYREGRFAKVPVIVGATNADLSLLFVKTKEEAFAQFGDKSRAAKVLYDSSGEGDTPLVIAAIGADRAMVEPARFVADSVTRHGAPAWAYRFSYVADSMKSRVPGAVHASEVPYIMGTVDAKYGGATTGQDRAASALMHRYWVNFARTGDPNGGGLPTWQAYSPKTDALMELTREGRAQPGPDPRREHLDLVCAVTSPETCPAR
ncbi:carboxylesterase family protein [Sphingobium sp. 3R8]|uniref:carboxylesterase/lipase family protein n=1 Tax=Sphingobium sp. 3R8 TaxID=2874921 RepID=UPI001CCD41DA|nr:carboxylesterase family protein [Sphingobium sp. 3R8]MBZ9650307.1 carboxylesterase family protein [Sphingobium sp. 3R8]